MKKKGFTLIELLVVIAIIAMLLAILMPALNKVKKIAQRVVCGTNLKGLGTAQIVYANDYDDAFVVQGGTGVHTWANNTGGWQSTIKNWATTGFITVGASLYLLVRDTDVSPKSFVCPSGTETAYDGANANNLDITELWDFSSRNNGGGPIEHVSYSYQMPYGNPAPAGAGRYAADGTRSASFAVMADKSLWYDSRLKTGAFTAPDYIEHVRRLGGYWGNPAVPSWQIDSANSQPHERGGQNVMFGDGHNAYETTSDVGINHDNIYTIRIPGGTGATAVNNVRQGRPGPYGIDNTLQPTGIKDSFLVNDDTGPTPP